MPAADRRRATERTDVRVTMGDMSAVAPTSFDQLITEALDDPGLTDRTEREPDYAAELVSSAREVAGAAFDDRDDAALDAAHRALYALYAQNAWSPEGAVRVNQHDPTMAAVLHQLERGLERSLAQYELPEQPPKAPEEFAPWLAELALERDLPADPPTGMPALLDNVITLEQLKEIVAQRSLFFLKEPDPWAMVIPSLHGEAKAGLLDLLLDEYGWGRYDQMHSTIYEELMAELEMETGYDAYAARSSWQFLATMNLQNLYARHRRLCRRMYGYVYLIEADSPRAMKHYLAAWDRLGLGDNEQVTKFYELHVTADEGHQDVALNEVIVPVLKQQPNAGPEIARGVMEGRIIEGEFGRHLHACFTAGRSSLREVSA